MNSDPKQGSTTEDGKFVLLLPRQLTNKVGLLRDVYYETKPLAYAAHQLLEEAYERFVKESASAMARPTEESPK